jgi:mannose-1-phosphate guanylyltransferase
MTKHSRATKPKAVILVGGPGTRLRPLTRDRPKSVVPLLNHPAIEHTFAYLKQYGIEDIILAMNYLPDVIKGYFGDGRRCGVRITYCLEKEPLGTAGAVKNAAYHLDGPFFVLNGDLFTDLNLAEMLAFHRQRGAKASIALTWVDDPSAFGVVETDENKKVRRFIEKPPLGEAATHWINAGTYILEPEVLDRIPPETHYMFENGLFPGLLAAGEPVYGYPYRGFWLDMGTLRNYFSINMDLLMSRVKSPLITPFPSGQEGVRLGTGATLHPSASVTPPVLVDDGCRIGPGVRLSGPVVVGRDCRLDEGAVVGNSILWDNVIVSPRCRVENCIIGSQVTIESGREVVDSIVTSSQTVPLPRSG